MVGLIFLALYLAVTVFLISLAIRLVRATERIAETLERRAS